MRKHYPRLDTSICPDAEECERNGHYPGVEFGDCCECCGRVAEEETK